MDRTLVYEGTDYSNIRRRKRKNSNERKTRRQPRLSSPAAPNAGNTLALQQMHPNLSDGPDQGTGNVNMDIDHEEFRHDQDNNSFNFEDYELYFRSIINQETAVVKLKPNLYTILDYSNPLVISPVCTVYNLNFMNIYLFKLKPLIYNTIFPFIKQETKCFFVNHNSNNDYHCSCSLEVNCIHTRGVEYYRKELLNENEGKYLPFNTFPFQKENFSNVVPTSLARPSLTSNAFLQHYHVSLLIQTSKPLSTIIETYFLFQIMYLLNHFIPSTMVITFS